MIFILVERKSFIPNSFLSHAQLQVGFKTGPDPQSTFLGRVKVLNGVIRILVSCAPRHLLPKEHYPSYQTCHRSFHQWVQKGVRQKILKTLSNLYARNRKTKEIDVADGSFSAVKRGDKVGKTKRGKGFKVMAIVTKKSRHLAISVFSATPFERTLLEQTTRERFFS